MLYVRHLSSIPVIADYFGCDNADNAEHLSIKLGLYQGMIKIKGMNKDIVEKAFWNNQLDKLIHDSYKQYERKGQKSGYYKCFVKKILKQVQLVYYK